MYTVAQWIDPTVRLSDLVALAALIVAGSAAFFGFRQLRVAAASNRARFLFDILRWHQDDPAVRAFFYRLDYNQWTFDPDTFPMSDDEPYIDRLLTLFDLVEHFIQIGVLKEAEVPIVQFEASQVMNNPQVRAYLRWLDTEFEKMGVPTPAFGRARALAERMRRSGSGVAPRTPPGGPPPSAPPSFRGWVS